MSNLLPKIGSRVLLDEILPCVDFEDGVPLEIGEILANDFDSNTFVIIVDPIYREVGDDGRREVSGDSGWRYYSPDLSRRQWISIQGDWEEV
jgi:hypothetical protein